MIRLLRSCVAGAVLALVGMACAEAHIALAEPMAPEGSYYAAVFRVGHGCQGSPTVALRVEVPVNVASARPQPKPGWTLTIEHAPLAKPVTVDGKDIGERISAVIWRGHLPDDQFDQFGLLVKLPDATGTLFFPVVQSCETGEARWTDLPNPQEPERKLEHPAPALTIGEGVAMPGMTHHH